MSTLFIRPSDVRELFKPQGPLFALLVPWTFVLLGQLFPLCDIIVPIISPFYLVVIANMVSVVLIALIWQIFSPQHLLSTRPNLSTIDIGKYFKRLVFFTLAVYLSLQAFQVFYFRGFPLLWLFFKTGKTYADFGIQSLNGLLNALFLLASTSFFVIAIKEKRRWQWWVVALLFLVPVLLVTRQLLMSLFLQAASVAILTSKKAMKRFIIAGFFLLAAFVIVGNLRTGLGTIVQILGPKEFIPEALYPLLWIWAYVVTPFNNINASFDQITPLGVPFFELRQLVPSIFRSALGIDGGETGFSLVHQNMTVSSFYLEPLLDFGALWAFLLMALFQVLLIGAYRRASRSRLPIHLIEYSVLYMIAILSIFSNLLLYLPVVAQLVFLNLAKLRLLKRRGLWFFRVGARV